MRSSFQSTRGSAMVLVLGTLVLLGLILAVHTTTVMALGTLGRALDDQRQVVADDRRFENITRESVQALRATAYQRSSGTLTSELALRLAVLNTGIPQSDPHLATQGAVSALPDMGMFPDLVFPNLGAVPADLPNLARPDIMRLVGPRVAVSQTFTADFSRGHVLAGQTNNWTTRVTARLVQAPLTRYPVVSYIRPNEVYATNFAPNPLPPSSPLPGGLVPSLDPAAVNDLRAFGVLPLNFRQRSVLVTAYQYVFSNGYIQRVINGAGVTHVGDLDVGAPIYPALTGQSVPVLNPVLSGVTEQVAGQEFTVDVGLAGTGTRLVGPSTYTDSKNLLVLYTRGGFPSKILHLTDSGGANDALLLVLAGGSDVAAPPLIVTVDSDIRRPIVIVGYNLRLGVSGSDRVVNGAVLLDTRCSVDTTAGIPHLAHMSYYLYSPNVTPSSFVCDQPMPAVAENIAPRVVYVAAGCSRP